MRVALGASQGTRRWWWRPSACPGATGKSPCLASVPVRGPVLLVDGRPSHAAVGRLWMSVACVAGLCVWGGAKRVQGILPASQRGALVDLFESTSGPSWLSNDGWLTGDPCLQTWRGVVCHLYNGSETVT
jgi:hypothetical protein